MTQKKFEDLMKFDDLDGLLQSMQKNQNEMASIIEDKKKTVYEENKKAAAFLVMWVSKQCTPEKAQTLAQAIGYNDTPLFFAQKKKMKLISEIIIANTAIVIFATNLVAKPANAKIIIDAYLDSATRTMFSRLEKVDSKFSAQYEKKISLYFSLLRSSNFSEMSNLFLADLGVQPSLNGQKFLYQKFMNSGTEVIEELKATIKCP